jgi:hypothetical protein
MFYIDDYLELEELFSLDIKRYIYPVDLPVFLGPPSRSYVKWFLIVKWFNIRGQKLRYYDDLNSEFKDNIERLYYFPNNPNKEWSYTSSNNFYSISNFQPLRNPDFHFKFIKYIWSLIIRLKMI